MFFAIGVPVFGVSTTSADISSAFSSMNSRILSSFESSSSDLRPPVPTPASQSTSAFSAGVLVVGVLLALLGDREFDLADDKRLDLGRDAVAANEHRGDRAVVLREERLRERSAPSGRGRSRNAPRTGSRWRSGGRPTLIIGFLAASGRSILSAPPSAFSGVMSSRSLSIVRNRSWSAIGIMHHDGALDRVLGDGRVEPERPLRIDALDPLPVGLQVLEDELHPLNDVFLAGQPATYSALSSSSLTDRSRTSIVGSAALRRLTRRPSRRRECRHQG